MKIAVFHPGTQHSWQTSLALQQLGLLEFYATSIFYQPDKWPYRIERYLPSPIAQSFHREFLRFSHPALDPKLVHTMGLAEWFERIASRTGARRLAKQIDTIGNRQFASALRSRIRSENEYGLWGFSGSSLDAFKEGKSRDRLRVLDRTIGDWRAHNTIMSDVYDKYPDFFLSDNYKIDQAQVDRDDQEYALADVILTGSSFAADTVRAVSDSAVAGKVRVLEYCYDESLFSGLPAPRPVDRKGPVRFLFLGQAGPRKGIHLVLKVFDRIPKSAATLTIVGDLQVPSSTYARYADRMQYNSTVARKDVPKLLTAHDVLLFPSYFEGAGLVLYEALAAGTAIIQSQNAAWAVTPDTGLMLKEISEDALYEAVNIAIEDRSRLDSWKAAGQAEANKYRFDGYRNRISDLIAEFS